MRHLSFYILCLFIYSCTNNESHNLLNEVNDSNAGVHAGATDTIVKSTIALQDGCYEMTMKRDTASLHLTIQDTTITGKLNYRWHDKDHNTGTIKGFLKDSLIIADYTFESEGMTSVREVVFKLKGDTLIQGFGDLEEQEGKIIFTNRERLQFMNENPFLKVNCNRIHK